MMTSLETVEYVNRLVGVDNRDSHSHYRQFVRSNTRFVVRVSDHHTVLATWILSNVNLQESKNITIVFLDEMIEPSREDSRVSYLDSNAPRWRRAFPNENKEFFEVIAFVYECKKLDEEDLILIANQLKSFFDGYVSNFSDPLYDERDKKAKKYLLKSNQRPRDISESVDKRTFEDYIYGIVMSMYFPDEVKNPDTTENTHLLNKYQRNVRSVTIRRNSDNTYSASVLINFRDIRNFKTPKRLKQVQQTTEAKGHDLGLLSFLTDSDGHKFGKFSAAKEEKKHKKMQRKHSRHFERSKNVWKRQQAALPEEQREKHFPGSNRLEKSRVRAAKAARHVADKRRHHHHEVSNKIINSELIIALESLNISGMMKNHKLAKAIQNQSFYMFLDMLKYKAQWFNRHIVQVGQFFASSKLCHECGYKNGLLKLSDREWVCPECGSVLDRDVNAAKNILSEALRILGASKQDNLVTDTLPLSSGNVKHRENPTVDDRAPANARKHLRSSGSVNCESKCTAAN